MRAVNSAVCFGLTFAFCISCQGARLSSLDQIEQSMNRTEAKVEALSLQSALQSGRVQGLLLLQRNLARELSAARAAYEQARDLYAKASVDLRDDKESQTASELYRDATRKYREAEYQYRLAALALSTLASHKEGGCGDAIAQESSLLEDLEDAEPRGIRRALERRLGRKVVRLFLRVMSIVDVVGKVADALGFLETCGTELMRN